MTAQDSQITVIGPDVRIRGEMSFDGTARILGQFEGKITTAGELQIGSSAHCTAAIEAGSVIVDGLVEGDILARGCVQLDGSARVNGDVVAERLVVAEGASFNGHCRVGPEAVANATASKTPAPTVEVKPGGPKFDWVGQPNGQTARAKTGWGPSAAKPTAGGAA